MKGSCEGKSKGLIDLLKNDEKYAARYAELLQDITCMKQAQLKQKYKGEFQSWKNRKFWCKKYKKPWDDGLVSFIGFLESVGPKPHIDDTLDRIASGGLYKLDNLRWASKAVQSMNRCTAVKFDVDGKIIKLHEAAALLGVKSDALRMRVYRHGKDVVVQQLRLAMGCVRKQPPAIEHSWRFPKMYMPEVEEAYQAAEGKYVSRYRFFKSELKAYLAEHERIMEQKKNVGASIFMEDYKVFLARRAKCLTRFADRQLLLLKHRAYLIDVEEQKRLAAERGETYQEQPEERWFPARGPWDNIGDGLEGFYY